MIRIQVQCTAAGAVCPGCGGRTSRVHSSYLRFPADLPSGGRRVVRPLPDPRGRIRSHPAQRPPVPTPPRDRTLESGPVHT
ncbi:transposase family protein [Streptomyces erythrochromogenes]|uniref:transposase family protein n=1 Tax=Streptomyces erythrochromogenes TaxID=285574 RepID=UPI003F4D0BE3